VAREYGTLGRMDVHILGSAGWVPTGNRHTSCYAIKSRDELLVLDAGTGITRLVTSTSLLDGTNDVHILLSHFHLDHTIGLTYLTALAKRVRVRIWGPGQLYGTSTRQILDVCTSPPYQPSPLSSLHEILDFPLSGLRLGHFQVDFREQRLHSAPSAAMRVNDALSYCTDTAYDPGNIGFTRGCKLLIHEAWPDESGPRSGHSAPEEAAKIAAEAKADRLLLSHVPPHANESSMLAQATRRFEAVEVAQDGATVPLV
jgi:ribonuclease BN (tRNA processing enzyme)